MHFTVRSVMLIALINLSSISANKVAAENLNPLKGIQGYDQTVGKPVNRWSLLGRNNDDPCGGQPRCPDHRSNPYLL